MDEELSYPLAYDVKKYALMVWALGVSRAVLYSVLEGNCEIEEVKRILDVTSLRALAARVGCDESDLAVDWTQHLSPEEQDVSFAP